MSEIDWAKLYAAMDERLLLKYQQLPEGEQIGKRPARESNDRFRSSVDAKTGSTPLRSE